MPQQCHLSPSSSGIVRGMYICICPYLFILPFFSVYTQSFSVVLLSCKFIKPSEIFLHPMASLTKFLSIVDFLKECSPWQDGIIASWNWRSNKKTAYFVRLRQVFQVIVISLVGICWFILHFSGYMLIYTSCLACFTVSLWVYNFHGCNPQFLSPKILFPFISVFHKYLFLQMSSLPVFYMPFSGCPYSLLILSP